MSRGAELLWYDWLMPQTAERAVAWSWHDAALGVAYAAPTVAVTVVNPSVGLACAVGVLPAAVVGLLGPRRARFVVVVVGALAGVSLWLGSVVSGLPVLAVLTIFVLAVAVALATANPSRRLAPLSLTLGLPLVGAGLSEHGPASGAGAAVLIVCGSLYAWLVSLLWPPGPRRARPPRPSPARAEMLRYGTQIGAAGACAAAIGLAAGLDHPGWACTAALLVSRRDVRLLRSRGLERAVSVVLGALVACGLDALDLPDALVGAAVALALVGATATTRSRWYVLPFFSTTIVLSMLLARGGPSSGHWFVERVGETLLGVGLALLAAWVAALTSRPAPAADVP